MCAYTNKMRENCKNSWTCSSFFATLLWKYKCLLHKCAIICSVNRIYADQNPICNINFIITCKQATYYASLITRLYSGDGTALSYLFEIQITTWIFLISLSKKKASSFQFVLIHQASVICWRWHQSFNKLSTHYISCK